MVDWRLGEWVAGERKSSTLDALERSADYLPETYTNMYLLARLRLTTIRTYSLLTGLAPITIRI